MDWVSIYKQIYFQLCIHFNEGINQLMNESTIVIWKKVLYLVLAPGILGHSR